MINDRLGSGALNAVRAHAVTYPAEVHLEDYAPFGGVAWLRQRCASMLRKEKILGTKVLGEH
jgi:hypothetical protein